MEHLRSNIDKNSKRTWRAVRKHAISIKKTAVTGYNAVSASLAYVFVGSVSGTMNFGLTKVSAFVNAANGGMDMFNDHMEILGMHANAALNALQIGLPQIELPQMEPVQVPQPFELGLEFEPVEPVEPVEPDPQPAQDQASDDGAESVVFDGAEPDAEDGYDTEIYVGQV